MKYTIKRNGVDLVTVRFEGQQEKEIMLKDIVVVSFVLPYAVDFAHGDYIDVWNERYVLNYLPNVTKKDNSEFAYQATFQAQYYNLAKSKLMFYDSLNVLSETEFEIMTDAQTLLNLIVANANRLQSGWTAGDCLSTDFKLLAFNGENVLQALDQASKEFDTEWWIINKTINLIKKGSNSGLKLEYGLGKGLWGEIVRNNADNTSVFSRLIVKGSDKNLPVGYRKRRLTLPSPMPAYIQGPKYGPEEIEDEITFEDIKPQRIGVISAVTDSNTFQDAGLNFDINNQIYPGLSAKVSFQTGALAGYVFEIAKNGYIHATRSITILTNDLENETLPTALVKPAVGDKYELVDIAMPASYVIEAENKLKIKGQDHFDQNASPKVSYSVTPDFMYFTKNQKTIVLGNYVNIKDYTLGLEKDIRVTSFVRDLHDQYRYLSFTVADTVEGSAIVRQYAEEEKLQKALSLNKINDINRARLNWKSAQELFNNYFDPDGNIYSEAINPVTIKTLMLEVGSTSQQLEMPGVDFISNYHADPSQIAWTAGQLVHLTIEENPRTWNIAGGLVTGLAPASPYYIYARVPKVGVNGTVVITKDQKVFDSEPGYYNFWVGFANSVIDNYRVIRSTSGSVRIYGRTIEGGSIIGNNLEINLDQGYVNGKVTFKTGSTGYENIADRPDLTNFATNTLVNDAIGKIQTQIDGQVVSWYYSYTPELTNYPASDWTDNATKDKHVGDLFFDKSKGYSYRFGFLDGVYSWDRITDIDIVLAMSSAQSAQYTADGKSIVFVNQPVTPYDIGDLWTLGAGGDLYRCIVARASGPFVGSDWEKATKYTDDTKANEAAGIALESRNYISNVLPGVLNDIQSQLDGQIDSFFYDYDPTTGNVPANAWVTTADKESHLNDTFTNNTSGNSWRWLNQGGVYQWVAIADTAAQQALALASLAKDTADHKRRVFVSEPVTPYDIGDLWTNGYDLFRCTVARSSGPYIASDWGRATVYDSTQVAIDNGIVTAGTVQLGNTGGVNAGVTGNGNSNSEVRFWSGAPYANRTTAPFRVLQDGSVIMTKATVQSGPSGGKRFIIDSLNNNARLVDANENPLVSFDDDSSVEGFYESTSPPVMFNGQYPSDYLGFYNNANGVNIYRYANLGPGVSVGISPTVGGGFSTMGRSGFFTTGRVVVGTGPNAVIIDETGISGGLSGGSKGTYKNIKNVGTNYALTDKDDILLFSGYPNGYVYVLPTTGVNEGRMLIVRGTPGIPMSVRANNTNYPIYQNSPIFLGYELFFHANTWLVLDALPAY